MARVSFPRLKNATLILALLMSAAPAAAQQLPPGITIEQLNQLTPEQRVLLMQWLRESGIPTAQAALPQEAMQLPESLIPVPDTTRGITQVDTTQFFVESPFDFGAIAGEIDSVQALELFGRRLFQMAPESFSPSTYGPVGADYRLGPGDQIVITLWGYYQTVFEQTINREGYVLIPEVGQVMLAYLTLEQAKRRMLLRMTPSYQALKNGEEGATAFLDVSLGKLRAIKVFVLGDALRPGAHTLSSVSTIFTALYAGGGPTNVGSLRDIHLIRGSRLVARLDGYDYLLRGDPTNDRRLEDGDIVLIPPIGPKVAVQGRVQRQATYELKTGETLEDIIATAGGPTASALLSRTQIARILPPAQRGANPWVRAFIDVNLEQLLADDDLEFQLFDGDVITVLPVPADHRDFVIIEGAVWSGGHQQWKEGLTLREAIILAGGLREEALTNRVEVIRTNPDESTTQISVSLERAMDGDPDNNITLQRRDRVEVFSVLEIYPRKYVSIYGQVQNPGDYLLHDNMTAIDLIVRAGGFTKDAWTVSAEVVRMNRAPDGSIAEFDRQMVPIDTTYTPLGPESFLLRDFDQVFIRQRPMWEERRNVILAGEVIFPGLYSLTREGETIVDLIRRAGGVSPNAYPEGTRFYREFEDAGRINLNLRKALQDPTSLDNLVMQPGDSLYVPPRVEFVIVRGEVGYPSSVLYVRGKRPKYYVAQAGGYTENADENRTRVTLPNGSTWQPRWFILPDPEVQPGSEIYVPRKEVSAKDTWEVIRDTVALLSSMTTVLLLVWQISK